MKAIIIASNWVTSIMVLLAVRYTSDNNIVFLFFTAAQVLYFGISSYILNKHKKTVDAFLKKFNKAFDKLAAK